MTVAAVTTAGIWDEDPAAEYFDGHADVGELPDPLDGKNSTDSQSFGVYETVDIPHAEGKDRVATRWEFDHRKDRIRARFVAGEFKGDETMCLRSELNSERKTHHRQLEPRKDVSRTNFRCDQHVLPRGRGRWMSATWIHVLNV